MSQLRIVVIGGSAAGPKAASRAKRLAPDADVALVQKGPDLSMASCGYPYYVEGLFDDRSKLLSSPAGEVRNAAFFADSKGVRARVGTEATAIDRQGKTVACVDTATGAADVVPYDKLILCTGSRPRLPDIPGIGLKGVTTLHELRDADLLRRVGDLGEVRNVLILGGGLVGVEAAEALLESGAEVALVEMLPHILPFLDHELARLVENHLRAKGVDVVTGNSVAALLGESGRLTGARLADGRELTCELAVVAVGVVPNVRLARDAGIVIGATGGIAVDEHMQTSDPDIYAAGDCVEVMHRVTGRKVLAPLGDLANLEGRVAGGNAAAGNRAAFPGTIQSGICKAFDFAAGSTGLTERRARQEGYEVVTAVNAGPDKPGFMGAKPIVSKMVAEAGTGRILGFQCVGSGDVNRQTAEAAMAVMNGNTVAEVAMADLPYAPPFSLAIDHFIATAHVLENKMAGLLHGASCAEVKGLVDRGEAPLLLDVRSPGEFRDLRLGIGEVSMPIGQLRGRLDELPRDKDAEIVCYCKVSMRGYEAQRVLEAGGWRNVTVMEGGINAWPYGTAK
jgi:NADPH-dependent 2,4-dienoyl-CoA reductase/sulfur reductase-like enzyme/rhodanese-related sulfurtransferase